MAITNIAEYFVQHLSTPDKALYRHFVDERWADVSVAEVALLIGRWQAALAARGLKRGDRIAVCIRNGVNWVGLDLAVLGLGMVVVPLYVDDNPDNVAWCVADAEAGMLVIENGRMADALAQSGAVLPPVLVLRSAPDESNKWPSVASALPLNAAPPQVEALSPDILATICYTSGTSGRPKGVMLSHANIIGNVTSCQKTGMARASDTFFSILPLSHMFERTGGYYLPLSLGAKVAFARGVSTLADDLASQAPTAMFAVPRIFEKFLERIRQTLATSPAKQWLFAQCAARGWRVAQHRASLVDAIAAPWLRTVVAKPILARLGGRMRLTVIGGAALDPAIAETFIGLGLPMLQGYGMTEASPVVSVNREEDNDPTSVGKPLPGVEVKLTDAAELLVRGPNVMQGYWRNPEATSKAIDADGWLHTGDLVELREGRIYIKGRLKDILVMSNGEKLPPQDAEFTLLRDPTFEQVMLVGEGRPFLTLLAVSKEADEKALVKRANGLLSKFPRWVRIRRAIVTREPWTIDENLLTPTQKLKRPQLLAKYQNAIDAIYRSESG